ncbi:MAG TPA: translation factor GTPase family protein [Micromonosporaceae bacterium]|nr:translation factor GTPase family protein [Micromonosporaceae bacterium]
MLRRTLNLGILAHVDAGKTTLSERLLYEAGVIGEVGRVDDGTTQTDSLALERQRGITIRAAVVSLAMGGTSINLIDTPGHPDFIAEVDRVLAVLDGAVLVISAVEGVQPQTRVLMRALQRLHVPTLLFINKIDRRGADVERTLAQIRRRLAITAVPMSRADGLGTRDVHVDGYTMDDDEFRTVLINALADQDETLLASYVDDASGVTSSVLRAGLAAQTRHTLVHPTYIGSAVTGAGVTALMDGLADLLPTAASNSDGPASGSIFKIERGASGEKVAYVRVSSGAVRIRDRLNGGRDKVTAISVFDDGAWVRRDVVSAGEIGKLWGLAHTRVGDAIGRRSAHDAQHHFAPPTLESVVIPVRHEDHVALRSALTQLAEQDPLINVRFEDAHNDLAVSLYGEVQKEVIQATLAADFGIEVEFRETTTLYIERPAGTGEAVEVLYTADNPFRATIGLRIEPAPPGSGIVFRLQVDFRTVPLFVYRNKDDFAANMEHYVRQTLKEGLRGWPVNDCTVTMIACNYSSPDGPPSTRGPLSTAADFRKLTPLVVMQALDDAGTTVCEPMSRVSIDSPVATMGSVVVELTTLGAAVEAQTIRCDDVTIDAVLPAAYVPDLHRKLPGLTGGEGVIEASLAGYQPARGTPPSRRRTMVNPLHRQEYLAFLSGHVSRPSAD